MTIGTTLKEARTKKELTLEDVHAKIKVHPRVLQLLEEEKFDKIPSPLFVKSFLRSYAQFLEVNTEELLESYEREKKTVEEPSQQLYLRPVNMSPAQKIPASWWGAGVAIALLFSIALFGLPSKLGQWVSGLKPAASAKSAKAKAAPKEKKAAPKAEEPAPEAPAGDWLNSVKLGNFPKLNRKQPLELQLKALDAVWVHITSDGKVLYQGVLKKGAAEKWTAKNALDIWTGNASSMALSLNGHALGSPGKGVVKKMTLSHEGIRIAPSGD